MNKNPHRFGACCLRFFCATSFFAVVVLGTSSVNAQTDKRGAVSHEDGPVPVPEASDTQVGTPGADGAAGNPGTPGGDGGHASANATSADNANTAHATGGTGGAGGDGNMPGAAGGNGGSWRGGERSGGEHRQPRSQRDFNRDGNRNTGRCRRCRGRRRAWRKWRCRREFHRVGCGGRVIAALAPSKPREAAERGVERPTVAMAEEAVIFSAPPAPAARGQIRVSLRINSLSLPPAGAVET